jgi:biopolymer transport protein ExbD
MNLGSKHKPDTAFSLASMTDIVFLLLIFFMLTSNFITPSGLPVTLPSSKSNTIVIPKITVSITKDLQFAVNDRKVGEAMVEQALTEAIKATNSEENVVVLHIDKEVPVQYLVKVAGVATQLKAKVSIATKPE